MRCPMHCQIFHRPFRRIVGALNARHCNRFQGRAALIVFSGGIACAGDNDPPKTPLHLGRNWAARHHDAFGSVEQGRERPVVAQHHRIVRI